ncbi:MAG TPA: GNAT family N-acetyltransferase [Streptosporangiaceae bacterium]|nr:GNAT family N-acetyltransferase [Streptosporangiaceae bacterium]
MTSPPYHSERLAPSHDVSGFRCGNQALDFWLREHAATAQAKRTSVTYVWTRGDRVVVAYYSLAPHLIENAELPRRLGRGDPRQIPGLLLARLALADELRGTGLGGVLLHDALTRAVAASQQVGGRYVVVDAIDQEAEHFYQHFGFAATPRPARLVRKVSDIEADIKN